jgi:hypothetical protein
MTNALHHTITKKLKQHDPTRNNAPRSKPANDQIRKNNARTAPPPTRLRRPQKLPKNDQTQKIRLNPRKALADFAALFLFQQSVKMYRSLGF